MNPYTLFLSLAAALTYVVGALLIKRSGEFGVGVWRTAFISNFISAGLFMMLMGLGGTFHPERWWEPAFVGLLFILGQVFTYLALQKGDVSVATPVLGVKILLVAFFSSLLLSQPVPLKLWIAAALGTFAIGMLNRRDATKHHHVGTTILFAVSSAAMFALFDVLVQKWVAGWGVGRFLPAMMMVAAGLNFGLVPLFREPLTKVPRAAWPWLLAGCFFIGVQSLIFVTAIARFGNATGANVIYSSRGLWSVVAVWLVGHWFGNRERHAGPRVMRWRLAGAVLMMAAIALVLI